MGIELCRNLTELCNNLGQLHHITPEDRTKNIWRLSREILLDTLGHDLSLDIVPVQARIFRT